MGQVNFVTALGLVALVFYFLGRYTGYKLALREIRGENDNIFRRALAMRWSPTAHQAYICMSGNQTIEEMESNLKQMNEFNERKEKNDD